MLKRRLDDNHCPSHCLQQGSHAEHVPKLHMAEAFPLINPVQVSGPESRLPAGRPSGATFGL